MRPTKIPTILLPISAAIIPLMGIITKWLAPDAYVPYMEHWLISGILLIGYLGAFRNEFIKKNTDYFFHISLFLLMMSLTWIAYKNNFDYMFVTNFQVSYILIGLTHRNARFVLIYIMINLIFYIYLHLQLVAPVVPFHAMFPSMVLLSSIMGFVTIIVIKKDEELKNAYTEKDLLLDSLKVSEKNIRAIFESSNQAFLLIDMDFKVLLFNNKTKIFSTQIINEEIKIGSFIIPFMIEKHLDKGKEMLHDARDRGIPSSVIGRYKISPNKYAWIEYHVNPVYNEDKIMGVFINIQDITKVKSAELRLRSSNKELEQFAYIASHDLKEPLRVVNSFSQLLGRKLSGSNDKDTLTYLNFITDGAKRMHNLLSDLMSYSTIGKNEEALEIVDLNETIEVVTQNLKINIEENDVTLNIGDLPKIQANASQMIHLFQNLVSNAIKFKKKNENPVIDIWCTTSHNMYKIKIKDNGIGIAKEYQSKIFEIFKRLHTKDQYEGTGIGLSLCQKIVTHLGGSIQVKSEAGKGSTFMICIPLQQKNIVYSSIK